MEKEWKIILYQTEEGISPIDDFLNLLSAADREKMTKWIEYLASVGPELRRPQGDYLRDDIYELRITLRGENTRTLYFFCYGDYIVLTHAFTKRTEKVPEAEIEKALKCKENFLKRFNKINIDEAYNVSGFHKI